MSYIFCRLIRTPIIRTFTNSNDIFDPYGKNMLFKSNVRPFMIKKGEKKKNKKDIFIIMSVKYLLTCQCILQVLPHRKGSLFSQ